MKNNKNELLTEIQDFLQLQESWNLNELIAEIVQETNLLHHKEMGKHTLAMDECGITWGENDFICMLDKFIDSYSNIFLKKIYNVLESYKDK